MSNFNGRGMKKIRMCEPTRNIRMAWARAKRWTVDHNWSRMIFFTDECKVDLDEQYSLYFKKGRRRMFTSGHRS